MAPDSQPVRVQNLLSICARVQASLHEIVHQPHAAEWPATHPQLAPLLARIRTHAAQVEEICARRRNTPAALPTPSRRAYQWLKYLSAPANLLAQLATMAEARQIIAQMQWLKEGELTQYSVSFELSYGSYLYHTRSMGGTHTENPKSELVPSHKTIRIMVAQGFSSAPSKILAALIKASLSRRQRKAREIVNAYVSGEDYAETALSFELAAALPQADVRGRCHDLAQSFARVNAAYFAGELSPPRLTWSRGITKRLMGCYLAERDTLMLSLTLDCADVPAHIVDFVMYHELLHRVLGVPLVNGRRRPHGRAYREAERKFEGYAEADAFLKQLAQAAHQNNQT